MQTIANEILDWEFNREFAGLFGMEFPFGVARIAALSDPDKGMVMIADSRYADAEDMAREWDSRMRGEMDSNDELSEKTEVVEAGTREIEIKGQTVNLKFDKTRGTESGLEYWEVIGIVPGRDNPTFVMLKVRADVYDEPTILDHFRNIR